MCSWIHGSSLSKLWVRTKFSRVSLRKFKEMSVNLLFPSFLNQHALVDVSVKGAIWSASVRTTHVATQWLDAAPAPQAGRDTTARKVRETNSFSPASLLSSGLKNITYQPYVTTGGPPWFCLLSNVMTVRIKNNFKRKLKLGQSGGFQQRAKYAALWRFRGGLLEI